MNSTMSFESLFHFSLFLLFSISASVGSPASISTSAVRGTKCSLSGHQYETGQVWFLQHKDKDLDFCVHCICKEDGRVNCSSVTCNPDLCGKANPPDCCKVCVGKRGSGGDSTEEQITGQHVSCLLDGRVYQDGQTFSSNSTTLQAPQPNQCVQCVCQAGIVLCRLKNCPAGSQCSHHQVNNLTDCCPSCKDEIETMQNIQSSPVVVTIMVSNSQSSSEDCTAGGITYSHGSSWHPVIGPFGQMDCVSCRCQNGKIECSRLTCPSVQTQACTRPLQMPGQCCPLCMGQNADGAGIGKRPAVQPSAKGKETVPALGGEAVCLPQQTNTLVFRSHASSSSSAYYQYAFQSLGSNRNTRLLTWTVKDGQIGDFSEQHLSWEQYNPLTKTFTFKLQGATRTRFMEKFIRKARKLPDRCGNRCTMKIQRLEQVLHLKEVNMGPKCDMPEVPFH